MNQRVGKRKRQRQPAGSAPEAKRFEDIALIGINDRAAQASLGLVFAGQTTAEAVTATLDDVGHLARCMLFIGNEMAREGVELPDINLPVAPSEPLECTQIGLVRLAENGLAVLRLRFGAVEVPVRVSTTEIRQALSLLDSASQGGLAPPVATTQ